MMPLTMKISIRKNTGKAFSLWIPLFIIWLAAIPVVILLSPLVLLVSLILWPTGKGKVILYFFPALFRLIWYMSGLNIDIQTKSSTFYLNLL
ncbi:MAG: hypothetical protein U9O59_08465 [Actinomycetota bacterium]|nr:hypothetical protein [Actinomycetota bacterium]